MGLSNVGSPEKLDFKQRKEESISEGLRFRVEGFWGFGDSWV